MAKITTNSSRVGDLPLRLATLKAYYENSEHIWDIGCDHGLLGLSFLGDPRVKSIHLVDPSERVIDSLNQKLINSHIPREKLHIHHLFGQNIKLSSQKNLLFIAGMGGQEILEILESLQPQLDSEDRVVVSPHRNILRLRQWLRQSDFRLFDESVMEENQQFYQILGLTKNSDHPLVSEFGSQIWSSSEGKRYRQRELFHFESHRDEASREYFSFLKGLFP